MKSDEIREVKVNKTVYVIVRKFTGKCHLQEIIERLILEEKSPK